MAVPTGDGALVRELSREARQAGLDVKVVPSVRELLGGEVRVGDLREPTEADLLGRHKVETDLQSVSDYIRGRTVVVTGAGGSIGSELCRQLSAFAPAQARDDRPRRVGPARRPALARGPGPARLRRARSCSTSATATASPGSSPRSSPTSCSTPPRSSTCRCSQAHPSEALKSNVWGTLSVLDAAAAPGSRHFVNISTDKAANSRERPRLLEARRRGAHRRGSASRYPRPLPQRPVRQRARQPGLGAHGVPGPDRPRRPAHRHPPRGHPLLHDHRGGGPARHPGRRDRRRRPRDGARHGRAGPHLRRRPPARHGPHRPRCRSSSPGCGRARSSTRTCSAPTRRRRAAPTSSSATSTSLRSTPTCVRDLDPTGTHAEVMDLLVGLVADVDRRTAAPFAAAGHLDLELDLEELDLPRGLSRPVRAG